MTKIPVKVVAEMLELKTSNAVYQLMKRDETFPRPAKLGKVSRWIRADVEAWLEAKLEPVRAENARRLKGGRHG